MLRGPEGRWHIRWSWSPRQIQSSYCQCWEPGSGSLQGQPIPLAMSHPHNSSETLMSNISLQWSRHIKVSVETLTSNWWRETETQNKLPSCCHSVSGLEPRPCSPPSPKHSVSQNALDHVFDGKQVWGTGETNFQSLSCLSHLFRKAEEQCRHQTEEPRSHQAGIMKQAGSESPALMYKCLKYNSKKTQWFK